MLTITHLYFVSTFDEDLPTCAEPVLCEISCFSRPLKITIGFNKMKSKFEILNNSLKSKSQMSNVCLQLFVLFNDKQLFIEIIKLFTGFCYSIANLRVD
jgi:hypothetical protein